MRRLKRRASRNRPKRSRCQPRRSGHERQHPPSGSDGGPRGRKAGRPTGIKPVTPTGLTERDHAVRPPCLTQVQPGASERVQRRCETRHSEVRSEIRALSGRLPAWGSTLPLRDRRFQRCLTRLTRFLEIRVGPEREHLRLAATTHRIGEAAGQVPERPDIENEWVRMARHRAD